MKRPALVALALTVTAGAALVAVSASGPPAAAAGPLVLGQAASAQSNLPCDQAGAHPTIIERSQPGGSPSYVVPSAGVVTSFTTYQESSTARGLVLRPNGSTDQYTMVGKSEPVTAAGDQLVALPSRIPVKPGDVIALQALSTAGTPTRCYSVGIGGYATREIAASVFDPETATPATVADFSGGAGQQQYLVNVSASLEPDVDQDGFGDLTQDLCPSNPAKQAACPEESPTPTPTPTVKPTPTSTPTTTPQAAPDTVLVGTVAKKTTKRKVSLKFSSPTAGATFRCQVDKAAAKPCSSPFKQKYKLGKHTVVITAVSPAGVADPTPLTVRFKVKPKSKKG